MVYSQIPESVRRRLRSHRFVRYYRDLPRDLFRQSRVALRRTLLPARPVLSESEARAAEELRERGFTVFEKYWSRQQALALGRELERTVDLDENRRLECGATVKVQFANRTDSGLRRVYEVEKLHQELAAVRFDSLVLNVTSAASGIDFGSQLLVYQHNGPAVGAEGPWHFDTFYPEFKAFLFLCDVDDRCGPTAYVPGSHRHWWLRIKNQLLDYPKGKEVRLFDGAAIGRLPERETLLCGEAGSLLLLDGRGLHKATAPAGGSRSVLMNYLKVDAPRTKQRSEGMQKNRQPFDHATTLAGLPKKSNKSNPDE
jgi:hypothetical protein